MKKDVVYNRKWRNSNRKKSYAHSVLNWAVRTGAITKRPCEVCGAEPAQAHHYDYNKPLDVLWLCHKCHVKAHHPNAKPKTPAKIRIPAPKKVRKGPTQASLIKRKAEMLPVAKQLLQEGKSYGEIAKHVGASKGTIFKWLNDVDYK